MYLFIHHCDLRIEDNTTLNHLWADNKEIQPIFIFTPEQIDDKQNQYRYVSNVIIPEDTSIISTSNINQSHCKKVQTPVYNPNNKQFAQQGAVSSSSLVTRLKYNTVTTAGASLRTAFGANTANALAYNSSFVGYTIKDKVGYPLPKYPTFSKYSPDVKSSCDVSLRG